MKIRKLFRRRNAPVDDTNTILLGEHFASIRTAATEIRDFREKTIFPTPTHKVRKQINLNDSWESSRELFIQVFGILNDIALHFGLEQGRFVRGQGFVHALDSFTNTLDRITYGLVDALGTGRYSSKELKSIDDRILLVQSGINRLRKHVTEDFIYPTTSIRKTITDNYSEKAESETSADHLVNG